MLPESGVGCAGSVDVEPPHATKKNGSRAIERIGHEHAPRGAGATPPNEHFRIRVEYADTMQSLMRSLSLSFVVSIVACGGSNVPLATYAPARPRPAIVEGSVPLTTPARWLFDSGDPGVAMLDLAAHGRLYTAPHGLRWLAREGTLAAAETLLPEDILETFVLDGRVHFVGRDGHVFVTKTPLGPIEATHPLPRTPRAASFGNKTLLVVGNDGTVHRSLDGGAKWTEVIFVATGAARLARGVTIGANGRGIVEGSFGRAWSTVDDGAAFTPISLPNDARVWRDRKGEVRIGSSVLDGEATLVAATSAPPAFDDKPSTPPPPQRHLLVDGVFEARIGKSGFEISVRAPDAPAKWFVARALSDCDTIALGGRHARLYVACTRGNATTLLASTDGGDSFVEEARLEAAGPVTIHAGPDRWVALAPRCDKDCVSLFVRPASGGPFQPALRAPVRIDAFVARSGAVPAAIQRVGNLWSLITFNRDQATATATALAAKGEWSLGGFDDSGSIVAAHVDGQKIELVTFTSAGAKGAAHVIPLRRRRDERSSDGLERIALSVAGKRGLFAIGPRMYETLDGASTFTRVASATPDPNLRCLEWGCEIDRTLRLGWDLSAPEKPPSAPAPIDAPVKIAPTGAPVRCKPNGPSRTIRVPEAETTVAAPIGSARVAWISKHPGVQINVVDVADPKTTSLLPEQKDVTAEILQPGDDGIIAARLTKSRLEVAWWSSLSHKSTHVDLGDIAYASPRAPFVGFADNGVVLYTAGAAQPEVIFVDAASKITRFPGDALFARLDRARLVGATTKDVRTVLFSARGRVIAARVGKDGALTTATDSFRSDLFDHALRRGYRGPLPTVDGAFVARASDPVFAVAIARGDDHGNRFFRLPAWTAPELPAVTELATPTATTPACGTAIRGTSRVQLPLGLRERRVAVFDDGTAPRALAITDVVFAPTGTSTCVSAWVARAPDAELFVFADNSGLFLNSAKAKVTPLACSPATSTDLAKAVGLDDLAQEL